MLQRHAFGTDYMLDVVFRLREIIVRYEFLTAHLLDPDQTPFRPYVLGGGEALRIYLQRVEADVMRRALKQTGGNLVTAAKLANTSYRRQFNRPAKCTRIEVDDES